MLLELAGFTAVCGVFAGAVRWVFHISPRALPRPAGPPPDRTESVRRVLKHIVRRRIADLAEGSAAVIVGRVRAGADVLTSPVSQTACIGYHAVVPGFAEVARLLPVDVVDGTGVVHIDPTGLELAILRRLKYVVTARQVPMLRELAPNLPIDWPVTVEEATIVADAAIFVCGVPTYEAIPTDEYRENASRWVLRSTPTFPLVASTDPDLAVAGKRPIEPEELRRSASH